MRINRKRIPYVANTRKSHAIQDTLGPLARDMATSHWLRLTIGLFQFYLLHVSREFGPTQAAPRVCILKINESRPNCLPQKNMPRIAPALQVLLTSIFLVSCPRPNLQAFSPTYSLPSISVTSTSVKTLKHVLKHFCSLLGETCIDIEC